MKTRSKSIFHFLTLLAVLVSLFGSAVSVTPAYAATYTVTKTADTEDGTCDSDCSLREAIQAAESVSGPHTINLNGALTYTLIDAGGAQGQLPDYANGIDQTITINGNGATIQADSTNFRIFEVGSGTLTLNNVILKFGSCVNSYGCDTQSTGSSDRSNGGAIFNSGTLIINNSTISNNNANSSGGAIFNYSGTLTVTNTTFTSNTGGAIANPGSGTVTVTNSTFTSNIANGSGGGISNSNDLTVTGSTFHMNTASGSGGGIYNGGTLNLSMSSIHHNQANEGGGIYSSSQSTLTIANSTITSNTATNSDNSGGGIYTRDDMTLKNSTITANTGGGVYIKGDDEYEDNNNPLFITVSIINTILANTTSGNDCYYGSFYSSPNTAIITGSNNIIRTQGGDLSHTCGTTSPLTSDPLLGALTGTPSYLPLNVGSPAIDSGDASTCSAFPVSNASQNGVTRPLDGDAIVGAVCDIGSFEYTAVVVPPPTPTEQALNGGFEKYSPSTSKVPYKWVKSSNFGLTDGKTTVHKVGKFSVRITGSGTQKKTLTQTLSSTTGFTGGASGSAVTFSFYVKGSLVPATGKCMGQISLYNGPTVTTQTVACPKGTFGFTKKSITFNAPFAYTKAIIRFTYQKSGGTVWFDVVSLKK